MNVPNFRRIRIAACAVAGVIVLFTGCGGFVGTDGEGPRTTLDLVTANLGSEHLENENNNLLNFAEPVDLNAGARVIRGSIDGSNDVDVYDLGTVEPGDRILVTLSTDGAPEAAMALFDDSEACLLVNDHRNVYLGRNGPFVDVVIRRPSTACYLAISTTPGYAAVEEYALVASREVGLSIPQPEPDVILLNFEGGTRVAVGTRPRITVPAFTAASISEVYAGQTGEMTREIVQLVREDFFGFNVLIQSTSEGAVYDGSQSRIYFGTFDEALLGVAEGVDEFNASESQEAIVFTDTFGAFMPLAPSVSEMAQAIANVGSHEIGHLLGLVHTSDPLGIMDVTAGLSELLADQYFNKSPIYSAVFPVGQLDQVQSLFDAVGGEEPIELLKAMRRPLDNLKSRHDRSRRIPRSQLLLSTCTLHPECN